MFFKEKTRKKLKKSWAYGYYSYDLGVPASGYEDERYIFEPPLTLNYIEQIASALAGENKVKLEKGDEWGLDLKTKTLTYNPVILKWATKSEVIGTILHEIGHLRHSTGTSYLKSPWVEKYPRACKEVLNVFEDFRVDAIMEKAYSGAEGIYEFNRKAMKEEGHKRFEAIIEEAGKIKGHAYELSQKIKIAHSSLPQKLRELPTEKRTEVADTLEKNIPQFSQELILYCGEMCFRGIGLKSKKVPPKIEKYADLTETVIEEGKKAKSTGELLKLLDEKVYPIIEDLLKDHEKMESLTQSIAEALKEIIADAIRKAVSRSRENPEITARGRGGKEYAEHQDQSIANYDEVLARLQPEIKKLVKTIKSLKTQEDTQVYLNKKRWGRVDIKRLYKARLDETKVFSRLAKNEQHINSMAFSLLVDVSGSMDWRPLKNSSLECSVLLAEVAKLTKIPLEITAFDHNVFPLKKFSEILTPALTKKIYQRVYRCNGGNDIIKGWRSSELPRHPKRNKFMFLITDGGEDDIKETEREARKFFTKTSITPYFLHIGTSDYCYIDKGFSVDVKDPSNLIVELSSIIKKVVKGQLKYGKT